MAAVAQAEAFLGRVEGGLAQPEEFELDGQAVMKVAVSARGGGGAAVGGWGRLSQFSHAGCANTGSHDRGRARVAGLCLGCGQTGAQQWRGCQPASQPAGHSGVHNGERCLLGW